MRKVTESLGLVMFIGGIAITGYSLATLLNYDSSFKGDWRITFALGVALAFLGVLLYLWKRELSFYWSEPNITFDTRIDNESSDNMFYKNARLIVYNSEETPITDCFAIIEYAGEYYEQDKEIIEDKKIRGNRIRWSQSSFGNKNCEILIPPTESREVNVAHTKRDFEYLLCRKLGRPASVESHLHIIRIRIDGRFDNKAMKPQFFNGYLFHMIGESHIMYFGEGDWKNDDRVTSIIESSSL